MKDAYDVVVIGAGPGGYVAAIRAAQLGRRVAIIEREHWGGICLNLGCIPTKALLRNAELAYLLPRRAREFGARFDNLTWDYRVAFRRSRQVSERLASGVKLLMKKNGIDCIEGSATLKSPREVVVNRNRGEEEKQVLSASNLIIATGARPRPLAGIKVDGKKVTTYREAILAEELPSSAVIIGGGAIGVEFACIWNSYGVRVTIVEMLDRLLPGEDPEVSKVVEKTYTKMGITFHTGARVESLEKTPGGVKVAVHTPQGLQTLESEVALIAIGFEPNISKLGREETGIALTEKGGFISINDRMETSILGLYAVGDVTGKLMLAHAASAMGIIAAETIAGKNPEPLDYKMIPRCVYCQPQVASFGYTAEEARKDGYAVEIGQFPFLANGKAIGMGSRDGFIKIVAEKKTGKILGASLVGPEVTELLPELTLAESAGLTIKDIARNIHAHPTLSEVIQEAAQAVSGKAIHI